MLRCGLVTLQGTHLSFVVVVVVVVVLVVFVFVSVVCCRCRCRWWCASDAHRCPDIAKIKPKMMYAASKDALKKKLNGIHKELQATEFDEIDYDALVEAARSV